MRSTGAGTSSWVRRPASDTRHWLSSGPLQKLSSRVRRRLRPEVMAHVWCSAAAYLIDDNGMLNSADQPYSVRAAADCQGASQVASDVRPSSEMRPSACVPSALVMK